MCGIAGIVAPDWGAERIETNLRAMLGAIAHRGPDHEGVHVVNGAGIGMRRLSIIDLAGGLQPMFSPDGRQAMVFNGEIYNYRELRDELRALGHEFSTQSDSEVLLRGYSQWGSDVVDRLNGMFAFAVHDRDSGALLLARDHFGIKPLYTIRTSDSFAFCSEPGPLLSLPGAPRTLDREALAEFLAYKYVAAPRTFVAGMEKLPAASLVEVDRNGRLGAYRRFWSLRSKENADVEHLEEHFNDAVSRQLVSDVPVGVFLSGGIDSGLLAWAASRAESSVFDGGYTVGFEERDFDESGLAAQTAEHLGIRHILTRLDSPDAAMLDTWVARYQEPFANVSVPANFLISEWAGKNVRVVLNGSGADELFAGYDRYLAVNPPASLRALHGLAPLLRPVFDMLPAGQGKRSLVHRARRYLAGCSLSPCARHANSVALFTRAEARQIAPELSGCRDFVLDACRESTHSGRLESAIWADVNTMLPDDYLTLVDRTSMAASLEVRVPFLDVEFAEYAFSLPAECKMRAWKKKVALRDLAERALPQQIVQQPKMGFESPVGSWFSGGLGKKLLEKATASTFAPLFDHNAIRTLVQSHEQGRVDASKQLLALYTLFAWGEEYGIGL
jgi:asparagine synthase (glutamine-hydrolysing)